MADKEEIKEEVTALVNLVSDDTKNDKLKPISDNDIVTKQTDDVIHQIVQSKDVEQIKDLTSEFNLNMTKKNLLRISKLYSLLDKVTNQASERIDKRPDEFSNKEIMDFMNTVQMQIEKSQKYVETVNSDSPMIQINQQHNEFNINSGATLDTDAKNKILDVVNQLLEMSKKEKTENQVGIINAEAVEEDDEEKEERIEEGEN